MPSHSLRIDAQWWRDFGIYNSTSTIGGVDRLRPRFPRGYDSALAKNLNLQSVASASIDYGFTIPLGDVTWPWLYYLMRLQVVPFADVAVSHSVTQLPGGSVLDDHVLMPNQWPPVARYGYKQIFGSFGTDLLVNAHFFRIGAELNLGVRIAFPYASNAGVSGFDGPFFGFLLSNNL